MDKLAGLISIQTIEDQDKKINILKRIGLTSREIGDLLGVTEGRIRQSEGWKK